MKTIKPRDIKKVFGGSYQDHWKDLQDHFRAQAILEDSIISPEELLNTA